MKLAAFFALFLHATISLPDGAWHLSPGYCIPGDEAPPAVFDTDFRDVARGSEVLPCDQSLRLVRIRLGY